MSTEEKVRPVGRSTARETPGKGRLDIQLLRAVAVGVVVLYHLRPEILPGGYVGVDVFFVISGFLITSHLLRSAVDGGGIRIVAFWANRARRLLPLATLVLLATVVAVFVWMPPSTWRASLVNVIASTLYVQNWKLASDSVDYLARDQAPPITQHYWSLSVEEQFYIAWPLLVVVAGALAVRWFPRWFPAMSRPAAIRSGVLVALAAVFVSSFAYSLWTTWSQPGLAYFATTTRAWEFAAGALLSFLPDFRDAASRDRRVQGLRIALSWLGTALIVVAAVALPDGTPFPGVAALLPVVGAALFIAAGDTQRLYAPTALARVRPLTWIGDLSYGIYLWHWPLIVVVPIAFGLAERSFAAAVLVSVLAIGLAAASKSLIEDPFRYRRFWRANVRRGFYPAAVGMALTCLVSGIGIVAIDSVAATPTAPVAAGPLDRTRGNDPAAPLVPPLVARAEDKTVTYDCFDLERTGLRTCGYGPEGADVSIALAGDSHAAHLLPGLIAAVESRGWHLDTYVGLNCDAPLGDDCVGGAGMVDSLVAGGYDLVLTGSFRDSISEPGGYEQFLTVLDDAGVPVMPVVDTPYGPQSAYDCVDASGGDVTVAAQCTTERDVALDAIPDKTQGIADELGLPTLDLTDVFCSATVCESVINNTIVYYDPITSHMTTTFSRRLAPLLATEIASRLGLPEQAAQ